MFTPSAPATGASSSPAAASSQPRAAEESKTASAAGNGKPQINLNYDWYQNMTHVFVAYKSKMGGASLAEGLSVNFTDDSMVLENSSSGEILSQLEFSNPIDPAASSFTCSAKRIDIKLKKQ